MQGETFFVLTPSAPIGNIDEVVADDPRPEDWLPAVLEDVCQDIMKVLEALDSVRTTGLLN